MFRSDRFLVGIVVAVVALIVIAFVAALRQEPPTYRADAAPDAIAYNYLLALQNGDYGRAYAALAPTLPGYPDSVEQFVDDIGERGGGATFGGSSTSSFRVEPGDVAGERAVVSVTETSFRSSSLFESSAYTQAFDATLAEIDGAWQLRDMDAWQYWHPCWSEPDTDYCQRRASGIIAPPGPVSP